MTLDEIRAQHPEYNDLSDEQLADGLHRKFYSDMPREEFNAKVGIAPPKPVSQEGSFINPLVQGATFGWADEIAGGISGGLNVLQGGDFTSEYERVRDNARRQDAAFAERNPKTAIGLEIAGSLPTAAIPVGSAARGASLASKVGRGILSGAATGAVYGAGSAKEGERLGGAATGAAFGGAVGGAVPLAGRAASNIVGRVTGKNTVPSSAAIKNASGRLYKAAENSGVRIQSQSFSGLVNDVSNSVRKAGIDPSIHPKAYAALNRLEQAAGAQMDITEIETLRRVIGQAAKSIEPQERFMAAQMMSKLDDYMSRLKPADVLAGNPNAAIRTITEARRLWAMGAKSSLIEDLVERAKLSRTGFESGLRSEFSSLAKRPRDMRRFTAEEQAMIRKIASGGGMQALMRWLGKAAPTGIVSGALSPALGGALGGLPGAVALPAAGFAARKTAESMAGRGVDRLALTIRNSGRVPFSAPLAKAVEGPATKLLEVGGRAVLVPAAIEFARR